MNRLRQLPTLGKVLAMDRKVRPLKPRVALPTVLLSQLRSSRLQKLLGIFGAGC